MIVSKVGYGCNFSIGVFKSTAFIQNSGSKLLIIGTLDDPLLYLKTPADKVRWGFVKDDKHVTQLKKHGAVFYEGIYFVDCRETRIEGYGFRVVAIL